MCWTCRFYSSNLGITETIVAYNQETFSTIDCTRNKHSLVKFLWHKILKCHMQCIELHKRNISCQESMQAQLNNKIKYNQKENQKQLLINFLCILCSIDQNSPFQEATKEKGNFCKLVKLCNKITKIDHNLQSKYLSLKIQIEIIILIGKEIKRWKLQRVKMNYYNSMSINKATTVNSKSILTLVHRSCSNYFNIEETLSNICKINNLKKQTIADKVIVSLNL